MHLQRHLLEVLQIRLGAVQKALRRLGVGRKKHWSQEITRSRPRSHATVRHDDHRSGLEIHRLIGHEYLSIEMGVYCCHF